MSHRPFTFVFMVKFGIIICSLISIICNSLMVKLDDELYFSGTNNNYGGIYGFPGWFSQKLGMDTAQSDFYTWKTLNSIRGIAGILNWVLCSLCLDKTRYWSIVDQVRVQSREDNPNI